MLEKLKEIRSLVIEKKNDEAVEKLDELIAATPAEAEANAEEKPTVGGGGTGFPHK